MHVASFLSQAGSGSQRIVENNQTNTNDVLELCHEYLQEWFEIRKTIRGAMEGEGRQNPTQQRMLRHLAVELTRQYRALPALNFKNTPNELDHDWSRLHFLHELIERCKPSQAEILRVFESWDNNNSHTVYMNDQFFSELRSMSTPVYEELVRCTLEGSVSDGLSWILQLRTDLMNYLAWIKRDIQRRGSDGNSTVSGSQHVSLKELEKYLGHILQSYLVPTTGLLVEQLQYETASETVLDMLVRNEAVHPIADRTALFEQRFYPPESKRIFALFHPWLLSHAPFVVVYVALFPSIPHSMQQIYDEDDDSMDHSTSPMKVATFYSISNLEPAVSGLGMGEYLIKQAVKQLQIENPATDTFVTLSPIPGFRSWLQRYVSAHVKSAQEQSPWDGLVSPDDLKYISQVLQCDELEALPALLQVLSKMNGWHELQSEWDFDRLDRIMCRLVAHYLLREKQQQPPAKSQPMFLKPLDGVAKFHIGNGAVLFRINGCRSDPSTTGWKNSFGCMVNYRYYLEEIETNRLNFEINSYIPANAQVEELLLPLVLSGKEQSR